MSIFSNKSELCSKCVFCSGEVGFCLPTRVDVSSRPHRCGDATWFATCVATSVRFSSRMRRCRDAIRSAFCLATGVGAPCVALHCCVIHLFASCVDCLLDHHPVHIFGVLHHNCFYGSHPSIQTFLLPPIQFLHSSLILRSNFLFANFFDLCNASSLFSLPAASVDARCWSVSALLLFLARFLCSLVTRSV